MTPDPGGEANPGNAAGDAGEEERQDVDPVATANRLVGEPRKTGRLTLRVTNASEACPGAYLHWALFLRKPGPS